MGKYLSGGIVNIPTSHSFGSIDDILEELGALMGVGKREDGRFHHADMCQTGVVNDFAKFKPQNSTTLVNAWPDEQTRKNNHWGLSSMPCCVSTTELYNEAASSFKFVTHTKPWRIKDFHGYFHNAPKNVIHQTVGKQLIINTLFPYGNNVGFYVLQKTGYLAQKKVGTEITGIDTANSLGLTDAQLTRCITTEDLFWDNGETLYGTTKYYLGLVIYDTSGKFQKIVHCTQPLKIQEDKLDYNMYRMEPAFGLASGTYKAIAAAINTNLPSIEGNIPEQGSSTNPSIQETTYKFLPLQSTTSYPNIIEIISGGADKFAVTNILSNGKNAITTTGSSIVVSVTVKNNSGKKLEYSIDHISNYVNKWKLVVTITGSIKTNTSTTSINTTRTISYTDIFSINTNESKTFNFTVPNIWSNSNTSVPEIINSGNVTLNCKLYFGNEVFAEQEVGRPIIVTHGSQF